MSDEGAAVVLKATAGPHAGKEFRFDRHDIFIFGRSPDCQCSVPDDPYLSSNHFLIEADPPECELRDLGSKNGTFVNGEPCGRREKGEAAEEAARRARGVALKDGDVIGAGKTRFSVAVRAAPAKEAPPRGRPAPAAGEPRLAAKGKGAFTGFLDGLLQGRGGEKALEFPGYSIERMLAEGGMGRVYLARRAEDGLPVVLKIVKPRGGLASPGHAALFQREARVAMTLAHPNIVRFLADGFADGVFFFAMEYCAGGSVADLAARSGRRLEPARAAGIVLDALKGLEHAHGRGFVHRDIKPDNILLSAGERPQVKLSDFGLAKSFALAGLSGMTASGQGGGTLRYMPKEQLKDYRSAKPAADIFSMGATLYHLLTGRCVYDLERVADPCVAILRDMLVPIRKRGVPLPDGLADAVDRACAPDPRDRWAAAADFRAALEAVVRAG